MIPGFGGAIPSLHVTRQTGWKFPTGNAGSLWHNRQNVYADDNVYATEVVNVPNVTVSFDATTFGFSTQVLPDYARIVKVEIECGYYGGGGSAHDCKVGVRGKLSASPLTQHLLEVAVSKTVVVVDITSDHAWGASDFRDDIFRVQVDARQGNWTGGVDYNVDYVKVNVTWH